jgi:hypothetical protein
MIQVRSRMSEVGKTGYEVLTPFALATSHGTDTHARAVGALPILHATGRPSFADPMSCRCDHLPESSIHCKGIEVP